MDVTRVLRQGSLILGATALVACGGGGGDSSDGGDTAVALTCESPNVPVYELELDSEQYSTQTIDISIGSNVGGILGLYSDLEEGFDLVEDVRNAVTSQNADSSGSLDCSISGSATVTLAGTGDNTDERWQFNECVVETVNGRKILLNGTYRNVNESTGQTSNYQTREGFEDYAITGEIIPAVDTDPSQPLAIKGRSAFVFEYEFDTEDGCVTESISGLEFTLDDRYVALTDAETRLKRAGSDTEIGIKGKLIGSSINGYVQISTPTDVLFREPETCPIEGIISLASDGEAQVLIGSSTGGTAPAVAVWINGTSESFDDCQDIGIAPLY